MRETRLSGSEGGGILSDSTYPYSDFRFRLPHASAKYFVGNYLAPRFGKS